MFGKVFVVFQELFVVFADMGHRSLGLLQDAKVSKDTQARQVTEVGQVPQARQY